MSNAPDFDPLNATPEQTAEMVSGYMAGFYEKPMANLASMAWEHGYRNGRSDKTGFTDDDQRALAKRYAEAQRSPRP
jgi:hypothetical protein